MRRSLILVFLAIFAAMFAATVYASIDRSVFDAGRPLLSDPWFIATLVDAYLGFLIFYLWVAFKERSLAARLLWFVLIFSLGNMATAAYVLLQLLRLPPDAPIEKLLLGQRRESPDPAATHARAAT